MNKAVFENHDELEDVSEQDVNLEPQYMLPDQERVFLELVGKLISDVRPSIR